MAVPPRPSLTVTFARCAARLPTLHVAVVPDPEAHPDQENVSESPSGSLPVAVTVTPHGVLGRGWHVVDAADTVTVGA